MRNAFQKIQEGLHDPKWIITFVDHYPKPPAKVVAFFEGNDIEMIKAVQKKIDGSLYYRVASIEQVEIWEENNLLEKLP